MNQLDETLQTMTAEQRAAFEQWLGRERRSAGGDDRIVPRPDNRQYPLSFAQQRLWFLEQFQPGTAGFNIAHSIRLRGPLDLEAVREAFGQVVRRHETLRATFDSRDGMPIQVIHAPDYFRVQFYNLSHLPEAERLERARRQTAEEMARPFDLSKGPLIRCIFIKLGDEDHIQILVMHHIISDGWSLDIFRRETVAFYEAFRRGESPDLPDLPIQYADFAAWQRELLQGERLEALLDFWRRRLGRNPEPLNLPTDYPYPPEQTYLAKKESLVLSEELTREFRRFCGDRGASLYLGLLAAFKALLSRYAGGEDVTVGSPSAGRTRAELEPLIGLFVNTLVLKTSLAGRPSFEELLERVKETFFGAEAHQDVPFEKLVEELQPERDISRTPLFQVFFNLLNFGEGDENLPGLAVEPFMLHQPSSRFDLSFYAWEQERQLHWEWVYNAELFEPTTIRAMLRCFRRLLEVAIREPHRPVSALPILSPEEKAAKPLDEAIAPRPACEPFPEGEVEGTIAARFERMVEKHADRPAVHTPRCVWTYRELNERANRVAHALLRAAPPGPGRVALLFRHGAEMIAAILGVLKAGKTYVPLDPDHPAGRLQFILEDARVDALATQSELDELAERIAPKDLPRLSFEQIEASPDSTNPTLDIPPDTPAYLLYTSGSTGEPKGVIQTHRNALHFCRVYGRNLKIDCHDRLSLIASYGFDAAVMDIFGALLHGAALHPLDVKHDALRELQRRIGEQRLSVLHATPTAFRYLAGDVEDADIFAGVRAVVLGGEEVRETDLDLFHRRFSDDAVLINGLGPTESTLALQCIMPRKALPSGGAVPVGFPVEGVEAALLNDEGDDVEIYGEIVLRSPFLAPGYWNREEQTRRAFSADPDRPERRVYRTGDMGRRLPGGAIAFAGRRDRQIKIRGFRIEPGEIETALKRHPDVLEAVATTIEDNGHVRLVGYYVANARAAQPPETAELLRFLALKLPPYMLPSALVPLEAIPMTPNGKVDHAVLPMPVGGAQADGRGFVAPRSAVEEKIAQVWSQVLGVRPISVNANFFELGGHSMLAVQCIAHLRDAFKVDLPLRRLFEEPTIAGLARLIEISSRVENPRSRFESRRWQCLVPMQPNGNRRPFFLVAGAHAEEDDLLRFLTNMIPHLGLDQPVYGFKARGLDGQAIPHQSAEEMAADYIREMQSFQPRGPYLIGGECVGGIVAYEMAQQLTAAGHEVGLLVLMDTWRPSPTSAMRSRAVALDRKIRRRAAGVREFVSLSAAEKMEAVSRVTRRKFRSILPLNEKDVNLRRIQSIEVSYPRILLRYRPQPYSGKLSLIVNEVQHKVDPTMGWKDMAKGGLEIHWVPGNHMTRLTEFAYAAGEELRSCLESAQARESAVSA